MKPYDGPVLLWTNNKENFPNIRSKLKREFELVEAHFCEDAKLSRTLVFRDPREPNYRYIYRVRFNPNHRYGAFIDFKYAPYNYPEDKDQDTRAKIITRASELIDVVMVTDWVMNQLTLDYIN